MLTKRIIPCLDVTKGRVVKGTNFVNLRDAGDPVEQAASRDYRVTGSWGNPQVERIEREPPPNAAPRAVR